MEIKDVIVRSDPKVKLPNNSDRAAVSVWFVPESGDSFPILMQSGDLALGEGGLVGTEDFENEVSILDDISKIEDEVVGVYDGSRDFNDYDVILEDSPLKTHALSLLYSSVINDETSAEVLYCFGMSVDFSTGNDELDRELSESRDEISSRDYYDFSEYVELAAYFSTHNDEEYISLWGVNSEGKEECIFYDYSDQGVMPVSPEIEDGENRVVVSQEYYNLLFKVLAHADAQGSAIDGNIFLSDEDNFSEAEYMNFWRFLRVLQDAIERDLHVTGPLNKMFDLAGRKQDLDS